MTKVFEFLHEKNEVSESKLNKIVIMIKINKNLKLEEIFGERDNEEAI